MPAWDVTYIHPSTGAPTTILVFASDPDDAIAFLGDLHRLGYRVSAESVQVTSCKPNTERHTFPG